MVGRTRLQNGHWKSLNATIFTGALAEPFSGALPTSTETFSGAAGAAIITGLVAPPLVSSP